MWPFRFEIEFLSRKPDGMRHGARVVAIRGPDAAAELGMLAELVACEKAPPPVLPALLQCPAAAAGDEHPHVHLTHATAVAAAQALSASAPLNTEQSRCLQHAASWLSGQDRQEVPAPDCHRDLSQFCNPASLNADSQLSSCLFASEPDPNRRLTRRHMMKHAMSRSQAWCWSVGTPVQIVCELRLACEVAKDEEGWCCIALCTQILSIPLPAASWLSSNDRQEVPAPPCILVHPHHISDWRFRFKLLLDASTSHLKQDRRYLLQTAYWCIQITSQAGQYKGCFINNTALQTCAN